MSLPICNMPGMRIFMEDNLGCDDFSNESLSKSSLALTALWQLEMATAMICNPLPVFQLRAAPFL